MDIDVISNQMLMQGNRKNLVGLRVKHKTFGEGVIETCDDRYISVSFSEVVPVFIPKELHARYVGSIENRTKNPPPTI